MEDFKNFRDTERREARESQIFTDKILKSIKMIRSNYRRCLGKRPEDDFFSASRCASSTMIISSLPYQLGSKLRRLIY